MRRKNVVISETVYLLSERMTKKRINETHGISPTNIKRYCTPAKDVFSLFLRRRKLCVADMIRDERFPEGS